MHFSQISVMAPLSIWPGCPQARSENLHNQLKDTQSELQKVKQREQQLITRNCLLSKVAQINEVQKSVQCLLWEVSHLNLT